MQFKKQEVIDENGKVWLLSISGGAIKLEAPQVDAVADYSNRNKTRKRQLEKATMDLVGYFMGLGDDLLTAQGKVGQLSDSLAVYTFNYTLGNIQPMLDAINASGLVFMDDPAKAFAVAALTPA